MKIKAEIYLGDHRVVFFRRKYSDLNHKLFSLLNDIASDIQRGKINLPINYVDEINEIKYNEYTILPAKARSLSGNIEILITKT